MITGKVFLIKMYIRFNDDKDSRSWRSNATPLWACETWEEAKEDVLRQIKENGQNSLYKKLYFIQDIEVYKKVVK